MSIKGRLLEFIEHKKLNIAKFEHLCGLSNGYVHSMRKGIGHDKLEHISNTFPELSRSWLLLGEGEMIKHSESYKSRLDFINEKKLLQNKESTVLTGAKPRDIADDGYMNVPLIPVRGKAGYLTGYGDMKFIESLPRIPVVVDKEYRGKYRCFEVDGDSMDDNTRDAICDRDIVLGREIKRELWKCKLHIKEWEFVIVHTEGITIKRIVEHDIETGQIKCHSFNPFYEDFDLNLEDVIELYNVIKIVDRNRKR